MVNTVAERWHLLNDDDKVLLRFCIGVRTGKTPDLAVLPFYSINAARDAIAYTLMSRILSGVYQFHRVRVKLVSPCPRVELFFVWLMRYDWRIW